MSLDKMDRYKKEKERRKQGGYKSSKEKSDLKRDTICAVIVLLILICAPIGITLYSNHQAALQQQAQEEFIRQLQNSLATPSDANAAAESSAEGATGEAAAKESGAAGEIAAESGEAKAGEAAEAGQTAEGTEAAGTSAAAE